MGGSENQPSSNRVPVGVQIVPEYRSTVVKYSQVLSRCVSISLGYVRLYDKLIQISTTYHHKDSHVQRSEVCYSGWSNNTKAYICVIFLKMTNLFSSTPQKQAETLWEVV